MAKSRYARASTRDQNLDMQISALHEARCEQIYQEKASGVKERTEPGNCLHSLRSGDTLVVYKLDHLG